MKVAAIAFRERTEVVGDKEGPHACFSSPRKERAFAKPSPMLLVFLEYPITEGLPVTRPELPLDTPVVNLFFVRLRDMPGLHGIDSRRTPG